MTLARLQLALIGTLIMLAAIGGAWGFQLIGGYVPCELCLEQRIPYYVAIPLALIAMLTMARSDTLSRVLLILAAIAIFFSAWLGIYHAGAEWGFWPGPETCGGGADVRDASNMLAVLEETRIVSCTEAAGRFLGISFAGWNVVASVMAGIVLLAAAAVKRRPA
ncbi:disulfide bond formation protein B [Acuticoccus sp. M5D2P5]|uniref:disulfide bond formation protein B n=1 Tax=Acuticoccus kalidii TaxID=2910977 RepID=UPI001F3B97B2|nr:disulfide bond formation protein B [Acuticoccus kalidii]MCF3936180.1 disulfide bond formation protein B [Acuticoccus kalidii]